MRFLKELNTIEYKGIKYIKLISANEKFYYFKEFDKDNIKVISEKEYLNVLYAIEKQRPRTNNLETNDYIKSR